MRKLIMAFFGIATMALAGCVSTGPRLQSPLVYGSGQQPAAVYQVQNPVTQAGVLTQAQISNQCAALVDKMYSKPATAGVRNGLIAGLAGGAGGALLGVILEDEIGLNPGQMAMYLGGANALTVGALSVQNRADARKAMYQACVAGNGSLPVAAGFVGQ